MEKWDVIIVGTGPAGIFAALQLSKNPNIRILLLEQGKKLAERTRENILSGWGGSGAYSDGKLTLSSAVGGWLLDYISLETFKRYMKLVEDQYINYGANKELILEPNGKEIDELRRQAFKNGLQLIPFRILHLGTDKLKDILQGMFDDLNNRPNVDIKFDTTVKELLVEDNHVTGVKIASGEQYHCDKIIVACGRASSVWFRNELQRLKIAVQSRQVDIGVRIEIPAEISAPLTDLLYEFKVIFYSPTFDQLVRTFCVCPNGEVTIERGNDIITVNGHTYSDPKRKTSNTNFALLVSTKFTTPFNEPFKFGKAVSSLANLLSDNKVIIQRLADLKQGRRSTYDRLKRSIVTPTCKDAIPGDLSFVIPYRHLVSILEMIEALDSIIPGINSNNTFLYGVETKFYSNKLDLTDNFEIKGLKGLYAIGDGAGVTRSLAHASLNGIIVAEALLGDKEKREVAELLRS
ncbi:MAG: NAD(P)/FAD-dependent oxidoreductase [Promethearchaeota archaeon]